MYYDKLITGVAYHGNRILRHVDEDMRDIVRHNMNMVCHMYSHNDWDRHKKVMPDIFKCSEYYGLEIWVDNWGLAGSPGDKSHFLCYHPEAHQVYANGEIDPVNVCFNSADFVQFTKDWLDTVREAGAKKIFWDEPRYATKTLADGTEIMACHCENCKKLFRERFGYEMPCENSDDVKEFRISSLCHYFDTVTAYAASLGMENSTCVMLHTLDYTTRLIELPHLDDFGTDPYPHTKVHPEHDPYDYVYTATRDTIVLAEKYRKKNHLWIQAYDFLAGTEDQTILQADAAYDAGARTIVAWSYRGGESNSYRADCCERTWEVLGEAMGRIRSRHFDAVRAERLKKYQEMKQEKHR